MQDACKNLENNLNEELREKLDAALLTYDGPNLARKGNRSTAEFLLDETKATVQKLDPDLDPQGTEFRTAVILMAATCVVGPRVDLLVRFTGYSVMFVAGIARRMRRCGLWGDDEVDTDEWWDGDKIVNLPFCLHRLVAEGLLQAERNEDGEMLYSAIKSEPN